MAARLSATLSGSARAACRHTRRASCPDRQLRHFAGPLSSYKALAAAGKITVDPRQEKVLDKLEVLAKRLEKYSPPLGGVPRPAPAAGEPKPGSSSGGFFSGFFKSSASPAPAAPPKPVQQKLNVPPGAEKGLYVFGGCGTGKTFMMDLFHDNIAIETKRRVHFHEWLIEVHERLHRLQKKNALVVDTQKANATWTAESAREQRMALKKLGFDGTHGKTTSRGDASADLIQQVAEEMLREAWLLCFDEFQVTHISDAIIMKRLFTILFERGAVIVATSNRPPEDLYLNGLNRPLFTPFIPILRERNEVFDIDSSVDWRLATHTEDDDDRRVYITPLTDDHSKLLERKFYRMCHNEVSGGTFLQTQGRRIPIPKCGTKVASCWFNFKDLCDQPLGAADYFAICSSFHTVFVEGIPKLTLQERDQVRRLITMIDSFYERHVKLVCTADSDPIPLFSLSEDDKKLGTFDEVFAWDRTVSRLIEMQSVEYLANWARNMEGEAFLSMYDLASLSKDDIKDLWTRYDKDDSGEIDPEELKFLLEDVMEATQGHRNVSSVLVMDLLKAVDDSGDNLVQFEEFEQYVSANGLDVQRRVFKPKDPDGHRLSAAS